MGSQFQRRLPISSPSRNAKIDAFQRTIPKGRSAVQEGLPGKKYGNLRWKYMESAHVIWLKNIRIEDRYGNSGGFGMDLVLRRNPKIELNLFMWGLSFYISPIKNLKWIDPGLNHCFVWGVFCIRGRDENTMSLMGSFHPETNGNIRSPREKINIEGRNSHPVSFSNVFPFKQSSTPCSSQISKRIRINIETKVTQNKNASPSGSQQVPKLNGPRLFGPGPLIPGGWQISSRLVEAPPGRPGVWFRQRKDGDRRWIQYGTNQLGFEVFRCV